MKMTYTYKTQGTCSKAITIEIEDDGQTIKASATQAAATATLKVLQHL